MSGATAVEIRAVNVRKAHPLQQFGQANDAYTAQGHTGCIPTVLQFLYLFVKGQVLTIDRICQLAGYPNQSLVDPRYQRGFNGTEIRRFISATGLPYQVENDLTSEQILAARFKGPVGFGHKYDYWPEWTGFVYHAGGKTYTSDCRPNGCAKVNGRTQLAGFDGPHFGVLLAAGRWASGPRVYAWEPNHGTYVRPEKPGSDIISVAQFKRTYESFALTGQRLLAVVPTKQLK